MNEELFKKVLAGPYLIVYPIDTPDVNVPGKMNRSYNLSSAKFDMQDLSFITKMIDAKVIPHIYPAEAKMPEPVKLEPKKGKKK